MSHSVLLGNVLGCCIITVVIAVVCSCNIPRDEVTYVSCNGDSKFFPSLEGNIQRDEVLKAIETDEVGERLHFRGNSKSTGYIIYTVSLVI